jgi:hypothetical protein
MCVLFAANFALVWIVIRETEIGVGEAKPEMAVNRRILSW